MQRAIILILALVAAGGAYYFLQRTGSETPTVADDPLKGDGEKPVPKKVEGDAGLSPAKAKDVLPPPTTEPIALKTSSQALVIGTNQDSWNHLVLMVFSTMKDLSYRSWFLYDPSGEGAGVAGPARGLTALTDKPTAAYLEDEDIRLLVLDNMDPNGLPADFWAAVSRRVESGSMGLFVRPGFPATPEGQAMSAHPVLSHPVLKELLPVKTAALLSGTPTPGVFAEPQSLGATSAGLRHPATRLIAVPEVSAKAWADAKMGDGGLATKFCYPVETVKDGAQILVNCEAAASLPAIIATAPTSTPRVLWFGNVDLGHRTNYVQKKDALQKVLLNHMFIWLLGQQ